MLIQKKENALICEDMLSHSLNEYSASQQSYFYLEIHDRTGIQALV